MRRRIPRGLLLALLLGALGCGEREHSEAPTADAAAAGAERPVRPRKPPGMWQEAPPPQARLAELSEAERQRIEQLESIGYLAGSRAATSQRNVTRHDRERAWAGLNLLTSGHAPEAILMDMDGRVLHRWAASHSELYPESKVGRTHPGRAFWRRVALQPNGDLLVIFEGIGIARLDPASRPIWTSELKAHHDLQIMPDGSIYVLTREVASRPWHDEGRGFLEDFIVLLDADGKPLRKVSLFDALLDSEYAAFYEGQRNGFGDVFHTNTLEVLADGSGTRPPGFEPGRALVAMPMLDVTALVDLDEERVVWAHRGGYRYHHDPSLLDNGRILIFDNAGKAGRSRVIELDPVTDEITWEFAGSPERPLDSPSCSTAQRLPNGNTLITESDAGRALEVTPSGETVWEFYSPHRAGENQELVATLFEVLRLPPDFPIAWADGAAASDTAATAPGS